MTKDYDVSYDPKYTLVENQKNNGVSFGTIDTMKSRHEIRTIRPNKTEIPKKSKKTRLKISAAEPDDVDLYFMKMKRSQQILK